MFYCCTSFQFLLKLFLFSLSLQTILSIIPSLTCWIFLLSLITVTFIWLFSLTVPCYSSMLPPLCTPYLYPSFPSFSYCPSLVLSFFLKVFYVILLTNLYLLFSFSPLNPITPLSLCSFSVFLYVMFYLHAPFSASSRPKCPSNSKCMRLPGGDSSFHDNSRLRG